MRRHTWIWIAAAALAVPVAAQQRTPAKPRAPAPRPAPGLYMTFETTMGAIHCQLFPKAAPIAVRTISGLATGRLAYIDPRTHKRTVGKPFYDGLTFHRVIPGFMIQGGDALGNGSGQPGGPGFPFRNETHPWLKFDRPGRLALANAGPDTNGSQFFITEVPVLRLDGGYTIFGQCGDLNVVKAIARVPRNPANNRPLTPVVIRRVIVRRIASAPVHTPAASHPRAHTAHPGSAGRSN